MAQYPPSVAHTLADPDKRAAVRARLAAWQLATLARGGRVHGPCVLCEAPITRPTPICVMCAFPVHDAAAWRGIVHVDVIVRLHALLDAADG